MFRTRFDSYQVTLTVDGFTRLESAIFEQFVDLIGCHESLVAFLFRLGFRDVFRCLVIGFLFNLFGLLFSRVDLNRIDLLCSCLLCLLIGVNCT